MRANAIATTIRGVLGILQDEPDREAAWSELREIVGAIPSEDVPAEEVAELVELLRAARQEHEQRREYEAVARLLEIEADLVDGEPAVACLRELARVRDEELLDDEGATRAFERIAELVPSDPAAEEGLERGAAKREKWRDLVARYVAEASDADDASFKSSLLVSAAETAYRYGLGAGAKADGADGADADAEPPKSLRGGNKKKKGKGKAQPAKDPSNASNDRAALLEDVVRRLEEALALDPSSRRGTLLLERVLRELGRYDEVASRLSTFADETPSREEKIAAVVRLARVLAKKVGSPERAAEAYERVLDLLPGHVEATSKLVDFFTEHGMWDHLVSLYEGQLRGGGVPASQELGVTLQIAMVNWKMRDKPEAAEPYFEKLRRIEPAHPGMLGFFREHCRQKNDPARLLAVLGDAQRALADGPERAQIAGEIAALAEENANAQKAIDQWRTVLRSDPSNAAARDALKRLYRQTGAFHHLADVLRSELDAAPLDDAAARLPILGEISDIYRTHIKSDSALVTILSQILALDPSDASAVRELARVYESLGRWRDLLTTQLRLAELEPDTQVKAELYRSIARRWLDQFSNVQNAVEAYERLREAQPADREALEKLKELYTKRRAYRPLFELYESEASAASGAARRALWSEMAKIAADRLDRGADATRLYKQILAEDPEDLGALDALEKQAEREKDFVTVAEALEARARIATDEATQLSLLQKLGTVYGDRLHDAEGALRTWRRVLALSPRHTKALRILRESYLALGDYDGLTELYAPEGDWDGLVEVLSAAADRTTDPALKVDLSLRCAAIYEGQLGAPERAWRAYERVLSVRPDDERAARALVPICESEEKWARIPALLGILIGHAKDDGEKRDLYRKLAQIKGTKLGDRAAAFAASAKAFEIDPTDPDALAELEGWAHASGEWTAFAALLEGRIQESEGAERRALQLKLASGWVAEAGSSDEAVRAYRDLVENDPHDVEAVAALDRLLRTMPDRHDDLRWLFRHRIDRADEATKLDLLREWALLEEEAFGSPEGASSLYRELLTLAPDDVRSLRALARLLLATGDHAGAASLIERERDLVEGADRAAREVELARLYMGPLKNPEGALAAAVRALVLVPQDRAPVAILEELLPISETRVGAATALDRAYEATGAWAKQADVLAVLIATAPSKQDRLGLQQKLADVKTKLADPAGAFDVLRRATEEHPADLPLWDRLSSLATKTHRTKDFVDALAQALSAQPGTLSPEVELDLSERAAVVHDEVLGDVDRAAVHLERILSLDPANARAFGRLKQILTARERWKDLEGLYERTLGVTQDERRRVELLGEIALVAEEITADAPLAIHHYERVLEIEPSNERAIASLDALYTSQSRWQKLADLLQRRLALASDDEAADLRLRLGTLLFSQLGDPKAALDHLEAVILADTSVREARELVEKSLSHPDLRQRAAIILESVYTERDEIRDLVRVLDVRFEFAVDDAERRELLRRMAELRDERLTDDRGALEVYARLLPLSPGDVEARHRYLEIAARQGAREAAADVIASAAKNADAPELRAELFTEVARIHEDLGQIERAETFHRQILDLAPEDPSIALPAARSLERLYVRDPGKARELAQVLSVQVKLEEAPALRRELLGRLARLSEEKLADEAAAIAAWKSCLEEDPADAEALSELDRLYERTADHQALVEVLRAREQRADDPGTRKELMVRTARALSERLGDVPSAIVAYRAVLDDFGPDRDTLRAIAELYEKTGAWTDLAEIRETELGLTTEPADRATLLSSLGAIRHKKLGELPAAIDAYREALGIDPANEVPRAALEELLDDENVRSEAAEILRALYETGGSETKLARVLDIQIETEDDPDARLALFARASDVAEGPLGDLGLAFGYVARGVRASAGDERLSDWLARAERLTERTGAWPELVQLYREIAPDVLDDDRRIALLLRTAELARTKLSDASLAKQTYRAALDVRADDPKALSALEELYEEASEHEALLEILHRRTELAATDDARRALLAKQAKICDAELHDRDRAVEFNERILEIDFDRSAVSALERLYASLARWGDLVALHERELERSDTDAARRADLHHAIGEIHDRELTDFDRAFEEFENALRLDPMHGPTIASLERKMEQPTHAARAATMLEAVYVARLDWRRVMQALEARLSTNEDPEERRTLLRRLVKLHEEQEENYEAALGVAAKLLHEDPTLESTWTELERIARVANAERRLAEIYATELDGITADEPATARLSYRAGELFEAHGEDERALALFRRAYQFEPEEEQKAFAAIDRILQRLSRPAERVALYRDALDYRTEPDARMATLRKIAELEETALGDDDAAIATHRAILEIDEAESATHEALARLFTRRERFHDLADLYRRRAEQSALPEEEASFRLELSGVLDGRLDDPASAIDELETVLGVVDPASTAQGRAATAKLESLIDREGHKARVVELLAPVYEKTEDWKKLVGLSEHRFSLATSVADRVVVLRDRARLFEEHGSDLRGAFDALKEAFVSDPDDGESLEQLERVAAAGGFWDDLADAYERGITKIDGVGQRAILEALAKLHDTRRDDPRRALDAWQRLFELDESDERPLDAMDQLATLLSDWPTLVRVLVKRVELTPDDETRASLWRRIGEARRDMLDDLPGAIDAYDRALEIEPDSAFTLDNLIAANEERNDAARLVELYRRRMELCGEDDEDLHHQLLLDSARAYEVGLGDRREAIVLLERAIVRRPGDAEVLGRLAALFEAEQMWPALLDNLAARAASASNTDEIIALKKRIAELQASELEDPAAAVATYREVLAIGYDDGAARALVRIGTNDDDLRAEVADVLEPIVRGRAAEGGEGREIWELLIEVLELRLRASTDPAARAETRQNVARIAETSLGDNARAEAALAAALVDAPSDAALHAEAVRVASLVGPDGLRRYADVLADLSASATDATIATDLLVRLGRVAEGSLGDPSRAAQAYARAADRGGDTQEILGSLERVYAALDDAPLLANVLERRLSLESESVARTDLLHRLALLQLGPLGEKAQGLENLARALELEPVHAPSLAAAEDLLSDDTLFDETFEILERVYRTSQSGASLARLFERRVARGSSIRERTQARLDLARVLEGEAGDPVAAQRAVEAALREDFEDAAVIEVLERLAEKNGAWTEAVQSLSEALAAVSADPSREPSAEAWTRLGIWRRDRLHDDAAAEEAFARAFARDAENVTLARALEGTMRRPGRERDRVATLRKLVKLEGEPDVKRQAARDAVEIAEGALADRALAEDVLRDLLAESEVDAWALDELTRLRELALDHEQVVALLLRRAESELDAAASLELRHRAATTLADRLSDKPRAVALYEAILEHEPSDERARTLLLELYEELGKFDELARHLEHLVETAETVAERTSLRLRLAALRVERFDAPDHAADTLRAILDEDPDSQSGIAALTALFEKTSQNAELAELQKHIVERARARGDEEAEIEATLTLGDIYEHRLSDASAALRTYEEVLARRPSHPAALAAVARLAEQRGQWERAAEALGLLVEASDPAEVVALSLRLAQARSALGDDAGVEQALRGALAHDPKNTDVRARLEDVCLKAKKWFELADLLVGDADLLRDDHPPYDPPPMSVAASIPPPASDKSAVPAHVTSQVALLRRAAEIHLRERSDPAAAVPILERATALSPDDRELLLVLCDAYGSAHMDREAAVVLERVIASFGNKRTKELSVYHHRLGRARAKLGDRDVALAQFDMAFRINPGSIEILRDLGILALENNDLERAHKTFQALLLQRFDSTTVITKGEVFFYLGEVNLKQGNKAKAVQMLERAIESEPSLDRAKEMLTSLKN